jgi:hypothetical protein
MIFRGFSRQILDYVHIPLFAQTIRNKRDSVGRVMSTPTAGDGSPIA